MSAVERLLIEWEKSPYKQRSFIHELRTAIEADRRMEWFPVEVEHDQQGAFVYLSEGGGAPKPGSYWLVEMDR